jgi:hypothetical protein
LFYVGNSRNNHKGLRNLETSIFLNIIPIFGMIINFVLCWNFLMVEIWKKIYEQTILILLHLKSLPIILAKKGAKFGLLELLLIILRQNNSLSMKTLQNKWDKQRINYNRLNWTSSASKDSLFELLLRKINYLRERFYP